FRYRTRGAACLSSPRLPRLGARRRPTRRRWRGQHRRSESTSRNSSRSRGQFLLAESRARRGHVVRRAHSGLSPSRRRALWNHHASSRCARAPRAGDRSISGGRVKIAILFDGASALTARVDAMLELWDEVLVQRYVDGREINVAILGDTVLPISEIDFAAMPRGMWRIVTYQSKWAVGSEEDVGATPRCPADLPPK